MYDLQFDEDLYIAKLKPGKLESHFYQFNSFREIALKIFRLVARGSGSLYYLFIYVFISAGAAEWRPISLLSVYCTMYV